MGDRVNSPSPSPGPSSKTISSISSGSTTTGYSTGSEISSVTGTTLSSTLTTSSIPTDNKSEIKTIFLNPTNGKFPEDGDSINSSATGFGQLETFDSLLKLCGDAGCWQIKVFYLPIHLTG